MTETPARRPSKPWYTLEVLRTERVSEHMVRVHAGGPGFAGFVLNDFTDRYVKIAFPRPGVSYPEPFDPAWAQENLSPAEQPVTRTYTIRHVDLDAQELAIDFVVHGDEGLAGPWAARAVPGDRFTFRGPGGGYSPSPDADWHLLLGDDSALPAVSAALEALPTDARGLALIEVDTEADVQELTAPAGVELSWLFRRGVPAGESTVLVDAVSAADFPEGKVQAFVHGERGLVKALRDELIKRRGLDRKDLSISGYWAYGRVEDQFQAEKKTEIGKI
ncbi:siderophore-interacting protein [Arthrobacter woluwensis]|uniref:NADPH-dependent ferric siderophore reductase, contains FAD-binding and SIP domains n=1 Tax=Arthrobacter woluwensis TaxID=156980 RepID=A0A1H4T5M2_9MICC|nr:siderophore-interacting protein [Arthrobacter woluwensis]SEC51589.1 NADPH-dependent ferric siderophore reductase, contains FAD-binding and SIP domains [Arthrobacter woluwensis]